MPSGIYKRTPEMYESRRGRTPWNKGKTGIQRAWNKGLKGFMAKEKNGRWRGGRRIKDNGYVLVHCPEHPHNCYKYVYEHRLVMEKHLGRYLEHKEIVHHINGNRIDNRIENLKLFASDREHRKLHPIIKRGNKIVTLTIQPFENETITEGVPNELAQR